MFVSLGRLSTPGAEKFVFQSCLFCNRTGSTDTGSFEINTEETPAIKTVKPFVFTVRTGVVVRAYRAYARIAELYHHLSLPERWQGSDFL
jgi:hypothetical protein